MAVLSAHRMAKEKFKQDTSRLRQAVHEVELEDYKALKKIIAKNTEYSIFRHVELMNSKGSRLLMNKRPNEISLVLYFMKKGEKHHKNKSLVCNDPH